MSKPIQELANTMPHAIRNLTDLIGRAIDIEELGITQAQLGILHMLSENADPCQSVLAEQMCIDKSAILRQVDILEGKGWLERRMDPNDRRRKQLILSKSGMAVLTKALRMRDAEFSKVAEGIPAKDIEACTRVLRQLGENSSEAIARVKGIDKSDAQRNDR